MSVSYTTLSRALALDRATLARHVSAGCPDPASDLGGALSWIAAWRDRMLGQRERPDPPSRLLKGYREIGAYLGVHPSTVLRWARGRALPVSYLPNGRACITLSLIDQWLITRHVQQIPKSNVA